MDPPSRANGVVQVAEPTVQRGDQAGLPFPHGEDKEMMAVPHSPSLSIWWLPGRRSTAISGKWTAGQIPVPLSLAVEPRL